MQWFKLYVPFEDIQPGAPSPPASNCIGTILAQDLLLRAYRLSLLHGSAHVRMPAPWTLLHFHKHALPDGALTAFTVDTPVPEGAACANVLDEETGERLSDEELRRMQQAQRSDQPAA